ncbi:MAG TPA: DUF1361 domain-containing protein [Chthoniobacteraceae bacterium]|jgi:uncharacterized membrane protein|nr:DUF1361 domain-containing protein [Chthoniobacteraceae bacterium]
MPPPPRPRPLTRLTPVLWALLFGSVICSGMLAVRMMLGASTILSGLFFNLLLAWIPVGLALLLRDVDWQIGRRRRFFWLTGLLWVLFFPNSFYLVSDLIHIKKFGGNGIPDWLDMMITAGFALAGVFLGTLALYLVHLLVRERFGYRAGWTFAIVMLALGSFGIYVGRFLRWNSWDLFTRPWKIWGKLAKLAGESDRLAGFSVTFFFLSLMAYFFVVTMARVHEDQA